MATAEIETLLRSRLLSVVAAGIFLLVTSSLWVSGAGATPAAKTDPASAVPVSLENRRTNSIQLPGGLDPMDVVRMVDMNRAGAGNGPASAAPFPAATPTAAPVPLAPADEFGAAFQIGGEPAYGPIASDQRYPAVAFDGTNYLVVWEDYRSGFYHIYGTRVSKDGSLLDPGGIAISNAANNQYNPALAFDGTNYLVVWEDGRSGTYADIYGARVSIAGIVLDAGGIEVSTAANNQYNPAIAFDGTNYLVVWGDFRASAYSDIYGTRVSVAGTVLDPTGIPISAAMYAQSHPAVTFDGTKYFVVWDDQRSGIYPDIYGTRVTVAGIALDTGGIAISTAPLTQNNPAIVFDGTNYFVVWEDYRSGSNPDIYGARVSVVGSVLDLDGIAISTGANYEMHPATASDGTSHFVTWGDFRSGSYDIYGARVNAEGSVLDPGGILISAQAGNQLWPAIAFDGTDYFVIWSDLRSGSAYDVYGARVNAEGSVLDPDGLLISAEANKQLRPATAFDGTNYLVVWMDYHDASYADIYGARVSASGNLLDAAGIAISTAANDQYDPAIAFDGTNYLVVWSDLRDGESYDIYGARVNSEGSVLDPGGIAISTVMSDKRFPVVAFDGTNYLVVWMDIGMSSSYDIYGARVSVSGSVLDPGGIAISAGSAFEFFPAIAFDGTNYLVVWNDNRSLLSYDIYGTRVSAGGSVIDPDGIAISTAPGDQLYPAIAFDGTTYLVAWVDLRNGSSLDIYGARVNMAGSVVDPAGIAVSTEPYDQRDPAVAFDGVNYLVVWTDYRSGSYTTSDIYGSRVTVNGGVLDPQGLVVSTAAYAQAYPVVSRGKGCTALLAYTSFTPSPYGSDRIWGNIWRGPTAIAFARVSAMGSGGCVRLSWDMGYEASTYSFLIQRSDCPDGDFTSLEVPILRGRGLSFSCVDSSVVPGRTYWYKIVLVSASGEEVYGPIEVYAEPAPAAFVLHNAYPNPFNPLCTIIYEIPQSGHVRLQIFDVGGSLVRTLVDGWKEPGVYSEIWDGKALDGTMLPSGIYFCRLEGGDVTAKQKLVLLK